MATFSKLPLIGRFFAPAKPVPVRDWQAAYRTACFVLTCYDSSTRGEIEASYRSALGHWARDDEETGILTGQWDTIQDLHAAWVEVRKHDAPWLLEVTQHIARSAAEFERLYREPNSQELLTAFSMLAGRQGCFGIAPDAIAAEPYPVAHRGGFFAYGGPDSLPDAPSKRLTTALLSDLMIVMDTVIEKGAPGYQAARDNYKANSQKINEMTVLQSYGDMKDNAGIIQYEKMQAMTRNLVWTRAANGLGPALSVEDRTVQSLFDLRNDLWRNHRANTLAREHPVAWEAMTLDQIMMTWRAIHAGGGSCVDTTKYIPGAYPSWAAWSGSAWVAAREDLVERGQAGILDLQLAFALPPGWEPESDADREKVRKYGRWITETEYQPAPG